MVCRYDLIVNYFLLINYVYGWNEKDVIVEYMFWKFIGVLF